MSDCVFCKIGAHQLQAMVVYEDRESIAFRDIDPQAPLHLLLVPKHHFQSLNEVTDADAGLLGRMVLAAVRIARQEGLADRGYRVVFNTGTEGGQSVAHVHLHLLGGRSLAWPPG